MFIMMYPNLIKDPHFQKWAIMNLGQSETYDFSH